MKLGTTTHPKFCRLMRHLSLSRYCTVGVLESLWMMASQFTDDGDLSRFCADDISAYIDWPGDAEQLVDALVDCGWLDRDGGNLIVHDFDDHKPNFINDRIKKREQRAAAKAKKEAEKADASRVSRDCPRTSQDNRTESPLFQSIPVQPSQVDSRNKAPSVSSSEPALSQFQFPVKAKGGGTWTLPMAKLDEYIDTYGDRKWVDAELRKARQWCSDNRAKRKTPGGMLGFIGRWLAKANDTARPRTPGASSDDDLPEMEMRFASSKRSGVSR
ncbi:hypothetical protein Q31b_42350 [Novipirellula aureliae]|uniref:Lin1244/Lin1753-like N-terminal domain-containing protein n=1 Tax=Novipirellula aureliae TaxID=2527966 RepID=A0A5C6DQP1_9BACT|nr:hypothetical protein [Novipirellula aureliae]TWU39150.1 hypothetical protein Q31b_42350 [Novipirellula aureliae]